MDHFWHRVTIPDERSVSMSMDENLHCPCNRTEDEMADCRYEHCGVELSGYYNSVPLYTYVARVGFRRVSAMGGQQPLPTRQVKAYCQECGREPGREYSILCDACQPVDTPTLWTAEPAPVFAGEETEEAYIARRMREIMRDEGRDG
jgi:hypothetical protein